MRSYIFPLLLYFLSRISMFDSVEVWPLEKFKEAIHEDPHQILSKWNVEDEVPCKWSGISCSPTQDHVIKINISGYSLKGFIAPELSRISSLQELVLHGNELRGTIPKEIGMLSHLIVLDLGMNLLTGPIPSEIENLGSIKMINLESNGLTGKLPPELGNLKFLEELRLDRNKFQGNIPASRNSDMKSNTNEIHSSITKFGFCRSPQFKIADFSFNYFVGNIPKCLKYLPSESFQGNCLQDKLPKQRSAAHCKAVTNGGSNRLFNSKGKPQPMKDDKQRKGTKKPHWFLAPEILILFTLCSFFILSALVFLWKFSKKSSVVFPWKKLAIQKEHLMMHIDSEMLNRVERFSKQQLEEACEDYSNVIESSTEAMVFKGTMKGGTEIAVFTLLSKEQTWTDFLELYFMREVADLARLGHHNVGKFMGYCQESNPFTVMLVFEYASNGTLHEHLHCGEGCSLSWPQRMKIIIGISHGLKYLLVDLAPPFTILELSSKSVYLTEDCSPKLVDFERWKSILVRSEEHATSIESQGCSCMLPNSMVAEPADLQGNIYAFGLLLLEIITGKPPNSLDKMAKDSLEMPEAMCYLLDPKLNHFRYRDLEAICRAINLCLNLGPTRRPLMQELNSMLEDGIDTSAPLESNEHACAWAEAVLGLQSS